MTVSYTHLDVYKRQNMEICFEESDFDGFLKRLERFPGIDRLGTVTEQGWGQRVVRFYDPDGHIIEVGEEMKTVIERFLATGMTLEEVSVRTDVSVGDLTKMCIRDRHITDPETPRRIRVASSNPAEF